VDPSAPTAQSFGRFRLDLGRGEITRDGRPIRLGSRAMDILRVLVAANGALVSKDRVMERVWPGLVVEENNLHVHISALRKALEGDDGKSCIVTVPGRGYRFIGFRTEDASDRPRADPPETAADGPSIVVLPFKNMSAEPDQEYFADGMVEDIITALSRIRWLFVIARNSSFTYKGQAVDVRQVGRELGVRYVLEGSVRKGGHRLRITAQLIDAGSGAHLWAERYDRDLSDVFAIQDDITAQVAGVIEPALAEAERLGAWEAYQRGLWHFYKYSADDNITAQVFFRRAIEIDPNFAPGHYGIALAQHWEFWVYPTRPWAEVSGSGLREALLAVSLDDRDSMAHAVLSFMQQMCGQWEASIAEGRIAIELNPNSVWSQVAMGIACGWGGHPKEGIENLRRAMRTSPRDPLNVFCMFWTGLFHYFLREYEAAIDSLRDVIPRSPQLANRFARRWVAQALGELGHTAEAKEALIEAIALDTVFFDMFIRQRPPWMRPEEYAQAIEGLRKAGWEG
jgi:adenylate cyclase